jgi:neuropeptide Y receptor
VSNIPYYFIIALYASMILFGATGNLLVILVVVRNAAMRTARNVFIVNLAVSDLMLCLITMPLTLVEILYQTWQVGTGLSFITY